ncbi:MAG: formylglycine-generating enzyme family protein [Gammaproteobacteria bacterium]|nr:formylglycine-generating enzyme family protein [Gammaproteobacteria bacterium]
MVDGSSCPASPDTAVWTLTAAQWNTLVNAAGSSGNVAVKVTGPSLVLATQCSAPLTRISVSYGAGRDCNGNGVQDYCDIANGEPDCDGDGVLDFCDFASGAPDCNGNGVPDSCDIAGGTPDCNGDGVPDSCDIAGGTPDCNGNGVPDSCDIAGGAPDCNGNGVLDSCDIAGGAPDCDGNGVPDLCEICATGADEDRDYVLDVCEYRYGNFDLDGEVGGFDLSVILSLWGTAAPPYGDLDADGRVGGGDLTTLLVRWGPVGYQGDPYLCWATVLEAAPNPDVVTSASLRQAITATGLPWRVKDTATQIEFVLIPPGTFNMGCSASQQYGCFSFENPVHQVTLTNAFYLGRYEVTQAQWTAWMESNPSLFQSASAQVPLAQVPQRPVEYVTWNTIQGFLSQTGMRLPTEAEWEYAYRAGTTTAFHGYTGQEDGTNNDNLVGNIAWFNGNSNNQTRPVGGKLGNGFGLHDMAGNVWEWVNDWFGGNYYSTSPPVNPQGPSSGLYRVLRGGYWSDGSIGCRASNRYGGFPDDSIFNVGFRVARTP